MSIDHDSTDVYQEPTKYEFHPRLTMPPRNNKFWNTVDNGGISTCVVGNYCGSGEHSYSNVLKNCVGYAWGRFNEIGYGTEKFKTSLGVNTFKRVPGNPPQLYEDAWQYNLKVGKIPKLGALICWRLGSSSSGHVAVVEKINDDGSIVTSESGYGDLNHVDPKRGYDFAVCEYKNDYVTLKSSNSWNQGKRKGSLGQWLKDGGYRFLGFVYNPAVPDSASPGIQLPEDSSSGVTSAYTTDQIKNSINSAFGAASSYSPSKVEYDYETVTEQVLVKRPRTVEYAGELNQTKSASLLTYPTNIESPFIILKVGEYTFGTYNTKNIGSKVYVTYPNFISGMTVTKVNGQLNQYTINLVYQIQKGNDPNLIDKIFSSIGYGTVKISYGDFNAPNFQYKEEEAIITKLSSDVDFSAGRIRYTLLCTSTALGLIASAKTFSPRTAKPSEVIRELIENDKDIKETFTGIKSWSQAVANGWIATNDKVVEIEGSKGTDPLSYINYLVTCMICESDTGDDVITDSSYYLTIQEDAYGEYGGPYFTIKQMYSNTKTIHNEDVYEVDVGFPSETNVLSFNLKDDNSWSLLYEYNDNLNQDQYAYNIDNNGRITVDYSPAYSRSYTQYITTASQKTWWTQMTKFPISANLVIKGLLRPAMLMTYVKVNAFFYGQRHISSGLYFIIKQVDTVDSRGYRTTLSLVRCGGDEDAITTEMEERTRIIAKPRVVNSKSTLSQGNKSWVDHIENDFAYMADGQIISMNDGMNYAKGELDFVSELTKDGEVVATLSLDTANLSAGVN